MNDRRCGEHNSLYKGAIDSRLSEIRNMFTGVPIEHIFNMHESALQYRTTSSRSYVTINSDMRGVRRSKERITFPPIVSASGEKLQLQVIGKSKSPRTLKSIDIDKKFGIFYDDQKKAWQDGSSMLRLLYRFNKIAIQRRETFFILLDNCSSHVFAAKVWTRMEVKSASSLAIL